MGGEVVATATAAGAKMAMVVVAAAAAAVAATVWWHLWRLWRWWWRVRGLRGWAVCWDQPNQTAVLLVCDQFCGHGTLSRRNDLGRER